MVLEAAVNGRADALVTHNVRHFDKGAAMFAASDFLKQRAGKARPEDMRPFLNKAKRETPPVGNEI